MKSWRKILIIGIAVIIIGFSTLWLLSPYQLGAKISNSIKINAPCENTFAYLGNSANAQHWSVFVDRISTLNAHQVPDGQVGSKRICFTESDTSKFHWEEEIIELRENSYRKLTCYNYKNLWLAAPNLQTEQIYENDNNGTCHLTFTLDFLNEPSFIDLIKLKFAAYRISKIFHQNLSNIKAEIEEKYAK